MRRIAANETRGSGSDLNGCSRSADRNDVWLMRGELLEAERVHSIVGAFLTVFGPHPKFSRFIDFPKRSRNLIRARSSNSCPL